MEKNIETIVETSINVVPYVVLQSEITKKV